VPKGLTTPDWETLVLFPDALALNVPLTELKTKPFELVLFFKSTHRVELSKVYAAKPKGKNGINEPGFSIKVFNRTPANKLEVSLALISISKRPLLFVVFP
jgi:hypothetical protein